MSTRRSRRRSGRNVRVLRESARAHAEPDREARRDPARDAGAPRVGRRQPDARVLSAVADAFQVSLEELVAAPRAALELFPKGRVPVSMRGDVEVRKLLPDPIPGMEIDRFELPRAREDDRRPAHARHARVPHVRARRDRARRVGRARRSSRRATSSRSAATSATPTKIRAWPPQLGTRSWCSLAKNEMHPRRDVDCTSQNGDGPALSCEPVKMFQPPSAVVERMNP